MTELSISIFIPADGEKALISANSLMRDDATPGEIHMVKRFEALVMDFIEGHDDNLVLREKRTLIEESSKEWDIEAIPQDEPGVSF